MLDRGAVIVNRKVGEAVFIGDGEDRIVVEVLRRGGDGAKLRVEAPREVRISRSEPGEDVRA
jgi:carbon storage regulator CsrA